MPRGVISEAVLVRRALDVLRSHRALHHLPSNDVKALRDLLATEADARANLAAFAACADPSKDPGGRMLAVAAIRHLGEAHPQVIAANLYPCCASRTWGEHHLRNADGRCPGFLSRAERAQVNA